MNFKKLGLRVHVSTDIYLQKVLPLKVTDFSNNVVNINSKNFLDTCL
jgi:hypothetical protein